MNQRSGINRSGQAAEIQLTGTTIFFRSGLDNNSVAAGPLDTIFKRRDQPVISLTQIYSSHTVVTN